jgi:LPXTG-motif cell wall-anchored protein
VDTADLTTAEIIAVTPEQMEVPVTEAIQTTAPVEEAPAPAPVEVAAEELPKTASTVPLIALLGFASLGLALAVKRLS